MKIDWKLLEKEIEEYEKRKPKKFSYPKGSIKAAIEDVLNELKKEEL
jgi:hypothetical protein